MFKDIINLLIISGTVHPNPGPRQPMLSLAHLNVRSFCPSAHGTSDKFIEISSCVLMNKFDIFAVSETWLHSRIPNNNLVIEGYHGPLRRDRTVGRGGGVAVYIADYLAFKRKTELESSDIECLWVELTLGKFNVLCGVCYRPPSNRLGEDTFFSELQDQLDIIKTKHYSAVVLLGDV